mgnify:FL=1
MDVLDIIGPVMIGPSSSHTAGAVRIGKVAVSLLGTKPVKAEIMLHGSFAETYKGHGTDKALLAGIMGMEPDDERIRNSLELAKEEGLEYRFEKVYIENAHPNTARIILWDKDGRTCSIEAASVGGGSILVKKVNGMNVEFSGQYETLIVLHEDVAGMIAEVTYFMAERGINIGSFRCVRKEKGGAAVMIIECDSVVPKSVVDEIRKQPHVLSCVKVEKLK